MPIEATAGGDAGDVLYSFIGSAWIRCMHFVQKASNMPAQPHQATPQKTARPYPTRHGVVPSSPASRSHLTLHSQAQA